MADNEVKLLVMVETEGTEKLADVSNSLGKLDKTTTNQSLSTTKATTANLAMNTSLMKAVPQLAAVTPLMNALGLSSLTTASGLALAGIGLAKTVTNLISAQAGIVNYGVALGQYTSGPATTYAQNLAQTVALQNQFGVSNAQVTSSLSTLVQATHNQAQALVLFNEAAKVAQDTGKSLSDVSTDLANAYNGSTLAGKAAPASMDTAMGLAGVMDTQKSTRGQELSNIKNWFSTIFDPTSKNFIGAGLEQDWSRLTNIGNNPGQFLWPTKSSGSTTPSSQSGTTLNINIDGNKVANAVLDNVDGQIRLRGGQ